MSRASSPFVLPLTLTWAATAAAQVSEIHLLEELRLGRADGVESDMFADVHDISVDAQGRIYVVDPVWGIVRLYDQTGNRIRNILPSGDGPNERQYLAKHPFAPTRVTWDEARSRLWVDNGIWLQILDSLGVELGRDVRPPDFVRSREAMGKVVGVDTLGRVYEHQVIPSASRDSVLTFIARGMPAPDHSTGLTDTLMIDGRALVRDDQQGAMTVNPGRTVTLSVSRPARNAKLWDISPGGSIWIADGEHRLQELSFSGDTLRTLELGHRLAELDISPEGWLWLRHLTDTDESVWDVLDNCGLRRGVTTVPYEISLTEVGANGVVHAVASDELDIEYVVRLRIAAEVRQMNC